MEDNGLGLPLGGIGVDYAGVPAIQHKRTLTHINQFVTHTAHFLNRFSLVCEEKLAVITERIQHLQVTMTLLETKLSSIPGLESVTAQTSSATSGTTTISTDGSGSAPPPAATQSAIAPSAPTSILNQDDESDMSDEESGAQAASNSNVMTVRKDPRYQKFIQLTKVGVPIAALRAKMAAEGLDANLLEDIDQPVPDGGVKAAPNRREDFDSDDDDDDGEDDDDGDDDDESD